MKNRSLRTQLSLVLLGFLLLVISSVTVTSWLVQTQQSDAAIINLAGRQRMLLQQMTRLALTDPHNPERGLAINRFDQTLTALSKGGEVVDGNGRFLTLPPTTDPIILAQLDEISRSWASFQDELTSPIDNTRLRTNVESLLLTLDTIVSSYETVAQAKINRLRWVQLTFLVAAFLLLAWGYHIIRRHLLQPLTALDDTVQAYSVGRLDVPVPQLPDNELGRLGQTVESMRKEIGTHQISLEQQVAQRTQELTTAFEFSQEIVRELELSQLLQSVADHTRDLMQGEAVSVCVLDSNGRSLELVANSGTGNQHLGLRQSAVRGIALPVIREQKTIIGEGGCANCGFLHDFPDTSCASAPLQVGGRTLGALCVVRSEQPFSSEEARALTLLSNTAAIALENAYLIGASKQQAEENASLAERERLAANLHDNLAQNLGAMHLSVDLLTTDLAMGEDELAQQRIVELQKNLQQAYVQVRMALTGLREPEPDNDGFITAVHALLADFETQTSLPIQFDMDDKEEVRLTAVTQKQALHIIREALTNIRRHAQATQVRLIIVQDNERLTLAIVDNGIGFDPSQVNGQSHLGLTIMRTRAKRSQGQLFISSTPGQGTSVSAILPTRAVAEPELEGA